MLGVLVLRLTGEGYILVEERRRDGVLRELRERWEIISREGKCGSIRRAMELYAQLFYWVDRQGKKVARYRRGADIVLPPRNLTAVELKSLLGGYRR